MSLSAGEVFLGLSCTVSGFARATVLEIMGGWHGRRSSGANLVGDLAPICSSWEGSKDPGLCSLGVDLVNFPNVKKSFETCLVHGFGMTLALGYSQYDW